jgi:predicted RNA-binding Zn-ribbon protein involved in translation (DUF1610 family)
MMSKPALDIDLDKHLNATVVMPCPACGHEHRRHLKGLPLDSVWRCDCGGDMAFTAQHLNLANQRVQQIKASYGMNGG